ncbi:MAG: thioredoxin family protein [Ferrovibrio sp.]|uniref:thioredoxin family protein n=1 Tax=Ferrovibrio sp. TaxID=1917215 RepID=UPI002609EF4D|nr:thioredoxin family protein [Ferrovibrio sp.]MCW0233188.1 thioredoxin family protein [Ferrovibrio sp.]
MTVSRRFLLSAAAIGAAGLLAMPQLGLASGVTVGQPAPAFTVKDTNGKTVSLADLKGKTVVLEWSNHDCPFVKKHYSGNNMQALQKKWTAQNVVWLTIVSSPEGEQGYVHPAQANKLTTDRGAAPSAVLLDPKSQIARAYGAQVTPHMYVIDKTGRLAYAGGIDDKPSTRIDDLAGAKNYVDAALSELAQGKQVSTATSRPYGCTVKYAPPTT